MKRELKLNFGELRLVQKRVTEFQDALADIDGAAAYFDDVLGKQESEAAAVLAEHHQEMAEEICYFQDILEQLEALLGNYISDMESYIMPEDENRMMLVDRNDIWWNMKQIGSNLSSAKNVAHGVELVYYSGIDSTPSPPHIYEGMSPSAQSAAWARYRKQLEESRNRKKNYDRLENFCSGTAGNARSRLEEFYDSLEEIYKKHVIEFENTDDDYKRKAAEVYDACTSAGERIWDIGGKIAKLNNDITKGIDAAIYDFVSGIFGLAFTLLKVEAAVKIAAITVPFGITPQWVKDTGKEVMEGAQGIEQILRNPGRALASLGQQVTDTVEEEGITYALSYVAADVVIGILVDKGMGKLRGLDKTDDLAKLSTKVDDAVDVAEELGDTMKVVDKIDDVADAVDDVVTIGGVDNNIDGNLTIMSRNSSRGNPSAITHFDVELSTRQKNLLEKLPNCESSIVVNKSDVNLNDLAALTAKTGDEFAMFTRGSQRMIIRGNSSAVNVNANIAQELYNAGFKWSGHTHPGTGINVKFASEGDMYILEQFHQTQSVILDSQGNFNIFEIGD